MRTILTLALGIWIGRQIYINWDKGTAKKKEAEMLGKLKKNLKQLLDETVDDPQTVDVEQTFNELTKQ